MTTQTPSSEAAAEERGRAPAIFIDLDTVLLASHQGRRGIELGVQDNLEESIGRLAESADAIVVLAYPPGDHDGPRDTPERRVEVLRASMGAAAERLLVATCPHAADDRCDCAKPGSGLIELAIQQHSLPKHGWYVGADQEGVQSGRGAGLRTVRIGPLGVDHLSAVHKPDYEARDLLDAANHILIEELA